ncbi:MAG: hypothetical protein GX221_06280 [Candidatus Riflebacteria bacterium]|nr:hypothetical protein [Candidatus Riflebacteria bacterium]
MKKSIFKILLLSLLITLLPAPRAEALQSIRHYSSVENSLKEIYGSIKRIYKISFEMEKQTEAFMAPRHQFRYQFRPGKVHAKNTLDLASSALRHAKVLRGMISNTNVAQEKQICDWLIGSLEKVRDASKRSLRANADSSVALYLSSAQTIKAEILNAQYYFSALEQLINRSICISDQAIDDIY